MANFAAGDAVTVTDSPNTDLLPNGTEGTVTESFGGGYFLFVDTPTVSGSASEKGWALTADEVAAREV